MIRSANCEVYPDTVTYDYLQISVKMICNKFTRHYLFSIPSSVRKSQQPFCREGALIPTRGQIFSKIPQTFDQNKHSVSKGAPCRFKLLLMLHCSNFEAVQTPSARTKVGGNLQIYNNIVQHATAYFMRYNLVTYKEFLI